MITQQISSTIKLKLLLMSAIVYLQACSQNLDSYPSKKDSDEAAIGNNDINISNRETDENRQTTAYYAQTPINIAPSISATIKEVNPITSIIFLFGRTVVVNSSTLMIDASAGLTANNQAPLTTINNLSAGDTVKIYFTTAPGTNILFANQVIRQKSVIVNSSPDDDSEEDLDENEFEMLGTVEVFDQASALLVVNGVEIDLSLAEDMDEFMNIDLVGALVEVEGFMENDILFSDEIEIEDDEEMDDDSPDGISSMP